MDANLSMGSEGAVGLDLKAKLLGVPGAPMVIDYIAGLGGREINNQTIAKLVVSAEEVYRSGQVPPEPEWIDLNQAILP
jgi:pyruvate ferredoxin oxidoreductase alpha subunit